MLVRYMPRAPKSSAQDAFLTSCCLFIVNKLYARFTVCRE